MGDISIIEYFVYGLFAYSSMLMLIISTVKEVPESKRSSIVRATFMIPGIVCAFVLAGSGVNININSVDTLTITNDTVTTVFYEDTTTLDYITLINPIWVTFHFLIAAVLLIYVVKQVLLLLTSQE